MNNIQVGTGGESNDIEDKRRSGWWESKGSKVHVIGETVERIDLIDMINPLTIDNKVYLDFGTTDCFDFK